MKLVRLIKMCLKETYSKVHIGRNVSDKFSIQNNLKQGDVLSPLLFNFSVDYTIWKSQETWEELEVNVTHQLLVCADDVNILGENVNTIKKSTEDSKETDVAVCTERTKCLCKSRRHNAGQCRNITVVDKSLENVATFKCLGTAAATTEQLTAGPYPEPTGSNLSHHVLFL
jgi:hypothetical protein